MTWPRGVMSFSEAAVAIGLLTPLILGILAFIEKWANRKKVEPKEDEPKVVMGQTVGVDYAKELMEELKRDRDKAEADAREAIKQRDYYKAQLDIYKGSE